VWSCSKIFKVLQQRNIDPNEVRRPKAEGVSTSEIATDLEIGRASVYQVLSGSGGVGAPTEGIAWSRPAGARQQPSHYPLVRSRRLLWNSFCSAAFLAKVRRALPSLACSSKGHNSGTAASRWTSRDTRP